MMMSQLRLQQNYLDVRSYVCVKHTTCNIQHQCISGNRSKNWIIHGRNNFEVISRNLSQFVNFQNWMCFFTLHIILKEKLSSLSTTNTDNENLGTRHLWNQKEGSKRSKYTFLKGNVVEIV